MSFGTCDVRRFMPRKPLIALQLETVHQIKVAFTANRRCHASPLTKTGLSLLVAPVHNGQESGSGRSEIPGGYVRHSRLKLAALQTEPSVRVSAFLRNNSSMPDFKIVYDPRVAIPTLVGSALSCFATTCVLLAWMCCGQGKRSFRYALVLNLTFAEWVNGLNNTISGTIAVIHKGYLQPGSACTLNGWVGQLSVQAADFSILAIALVTLLTIKLKSYILNASFDKKILICLAVWAVPLATSNGPHSGNGSAHSLIGSLGTTAVAMKVMEPVSGNWCWISAEKTNLRYALTHGWRFGIIIVTILIYIYVFVYMRKRLSYLQETSRTFSYDYGRDLHDLGAMATPSANMDFKDGPRNEPLTVIDEENAGPGRTMTAQTKSKNKLLGVNTGLSVASSNIHSPISPMPPPSPAGMRRRKRGQSKSVEREIWRMLLLNAYPIMYVILWLPGIANRIAEATGHQYKWLQIMQCSTQYIGLANSITYGFKEHRRDFAMWIQSLHHEK
ncbi:hypothetical protein B0J12DRAFT_402349 [Macrophomina phaseolina]|uniref:Glucose receptor Git3-like N-terminal domain-containing protein n=1 Tax=Macrophomina phaseolina TaxID=35725 RepID=A0ABQ8GIE6_9PEZI|nr:hypothetical protein B0J12DRAFT_402349 [Macrophomina phaseolina]